MKRLLLDVVVVVAAVVATAFYMRDYCTRPLPPVRRGVGVAAGGTSADESAAPRFLTRAEVSVEYSSLGETLNDLLAWSDAVAHVAVRSVRVPVLTQLDRRTRPDITNTEYLMDVRSLWAARSGLSIGGNVTVVQIGGYVSEGEDVVQAFDLEFPSFFERREFVLFLRARSLGGYHITGGPQGTFQVLVDRIAPWSNSQLAHDVAGVRIEDFRKLLGRAEWPPRIP